MTFLLFVVVVLGSFLLLFFFSVCLFVYAKNVARPRSSARRLACNHLPFLDGLNVIAKLFVAMCSRCAKQK